MRDLKGGLSRKSQVLALLAVLLLTILIRRPFLNVPLERDEGGFAYGAQVMQRGGAPYRDTFEHKGPALFFAYRLAFALFGEGVRGIHLLLLAVILLSELGLFLLTRELFSAEAGLYACLAYAFLATAPVFGLGTAALTEVFMVCPVIWGACCLLSGIEAGGRGAAFFVTGAALGLAAMTKQTAVLEAGFLLAFGSWQAAVRLRPGQRVRLCVRLAGFYGLGFAIAPAVFFAYFHHAGALREFWRDAYLYNLIYSTYHADVGGSFLWLFRLLKDLAPGDGIFWAAAAAGVCALLLMKEAGKTLFVLGWLAVSVAAIFPGLRFYPHYLQEFYPPLALLAGLGLQRLAEVIERPARPDPLAGAFAAGFCVLCACSFPLLAHASAWASLSPEDLSRKMYRLEPFAASPPIGRYLRDNTGPGDSIYVFGSEPQILFYAGRESATRYDFIYPLTEKTPGALERQTAMLGEARAARPAFIVFVNVWASAMMTPGSELALLEGTRGLIHDSYELDSLVVLSDEGDQYFWGREGLRRVSQEDLESAGGRPCVFLYRRKKG